MKKIFALILLLATATVTVSTFTSCSDDEMGDTIFDPREYPLDRSLYSFPLDTFLKANFLEPYNVKFIYRMEDIGSDLQKNLVPAYYEQSVRLAVLTKYLWYDVYEKYGGADFLKANSPRILHIIGSKNYNVSQGTEVLGVAEGGLKITLYNVNNLNVNDLDNMNAYFFKTMHHEFGHILDQTRLHPTQFNTLSSGHYNSSSWQETPDSMSLGTGFITSYASSATSEDWVETIANYIVLDSLSWERRLNTASYEWEEIDYVDNYLKSHNATRWGADTIGIISVKENGQNKICRRKCVRNPDTDLPIYDENGNVQWEHVSGIDGRELILQKLDLCRTWMKTYFNINLDDIRREVHLRQFVTDAEGRVVYDQYGYPKNRINQPNEQGVLLIDELVEQVEKFKSLQTNH